MPDPQRLTDRVVLVTGAGRGIGAETSRRLAAEGATVVGTDVEVEALTQVMAELDRGAPHLQLELDVTSESAWVETIASVEAQLGHLDGLVNNAGRGSSAAVDVEIREVWDQILAINSTGMWLGMKHASTLMSAGASIVNLSSIFGTVGGFGVSAAYHAAKGAMRTLSKNAAIRWAGEGIRVNSLHPGFIATQRVEEIYAGSDTYDTLVANTPLGRLGAEAEVASVVAFLLSDESSFMTGSEVYVDGGWTAR